MQILNEEKCGQCGLPRYLCRNESNDLQFDIHEEQCVATAEKERYEDGLKKAVGKEWKPEPGSSLRPVPVLLSGGDPATLRDGYYRAEAEKRRELHAIDEADRLGVS